MKHFKFDQSCIQFICLKYVIRIHKASILFILDSPETTDQFVTPLLHRCAGYDGYVPRFLRMLGLRHLSALAFRKDWSYFAQIELWTLHFDHWIWGCNSGWHFLCQVMRAQRNDLIDGAFPLLVLWTIIGLLLFTFTHCNRLDLWSQQIGLLMFPWFRVSCKGPLVSCCLIHHILIAMRTCQFDPIHLMVERNQYKPMHICTHINAWIPVSFSLIQWEFLRAHTQHTQHIYKSYKTRDPCLPQLIDPLRHLDDPTPQSIGWFASVWQKVKPISGRARRKQFMWRRMDGDGCFL